MYNYSAKLKQPINEVSLNHEQFFAKQDKTWAEFSTLEVAICMLQIYGAIK
jgi:hypothetical protein